jgi:hypothetical protein
MKQRMCGIRIAFPALVLLALACSATDRFFDRDEPRLPISEEIIPILEECDATSSLTTETTLTLDTINEFGTRLCEYKMVITNDLTNSAVFPLIYVHQLDGYQDLDTGKWLLPGETAPLTSIEWAGYVYIYTDPDATGPVAQVAERIAGVYSNSECISSRSDQNFLKMISVELDPAPCSIVAGSLFLPSYTMLAK